MGTKVDMLNYASNFKCLGSGCRNTCCQYWDVNIDKETFEKYNKVKSAKFREYIKNNITKNVVDATYKDFAKVKIDKRSKRCSFLNTNNLCTIHKRLGEDYLCLVCETYPKHNNRFFDVMECSLSLSCEEACRLTLTSEDPMKVLKIDDNQTQRTLIALDIPVPEQAAAIRYIRTYLLKVLDCTDYTLEQKLIIIGILIQSIKDHTVTDQDGSGIISQDDFTREVDGQSTSLVNRAFDLSSYLSHPEECITHNINLLKEILTYKPSYYTDTYNNYRKILFNFINYDEENLTLNFDISHYHRTCKSFFADFMERTAYMLENYVKNYIYQVVFPFREARESSDIFEEYLILTFNYFIIKMHLMSLLNNTASIDENEVINLVTCFCRNYENNFDYEEFVLSLCKDNDMTNLYEISKLIL